MALALTRGPLRSGWKKPARCGDEACLRSSGRQVRDERQEQTLGRGGDEGHTLGWGSKGEIRQSVKRVSALYGAEMG